MKKHISFSFLALLLMICLVLTTACSGNQTSTTTTTGSSDSGEVITTTSANADTSSTSGGTTTSGKETGKSTTTTSKKGVNIVYKLPTDMNEVFPSKWTPTKKVDEIPANLKANVKSGEILYLTSAKLSDDELAEVSATFKKLTGKDLTLKYKLVDWNSLNSTLQTMVMAQQAPDLYRAYNGVAMFLRNKGLLRDMNEYINMNDAVWQEQQDLSKYMFYDYKLTGVATHSAIAFGFSYDKRYLGGLTDPFELYKQGKWNIDTLMDYAEKLTKKTGNVTTQFGISATPTCILRLGHSTGQDIVTIKEDGSYGNNLKSTVWSRYASYARKLEEIGTMSGSGTISDSGFGTGKCVLKESYWYANSLDSNLVKLKKANQIGWVPLPKDSKTDTYYHQVETQFYMLPENSDNPWGAAAFTYAIRYQKVNRDPAFANKEKKHYMDLGYTAEEYEYFTNGIYKDIVPVWCNWQNMPDFNYTDLQSCTTESWSTIVARANPKLEAALKVQNR